MHHAVNLRAQGIQQFFHHRGIGTGRRQHQLARIDGTAFHGIRQMQFTAVHQFVGHGMVVAFRVFFCQILGKDIVTRRGQTVTAHTAVVFFLISRLPVTGKSYNDIARANPCIVYHIAAFHAAGHGRIHNDGTHQVTHISRLTACGIDPHAHLAQFGQQLVRTVDDGRNNLTRHQQLIASDGRRYKDVIHRAHAKQIVNVHYQGILRDAFPHRQVARFFPIKVSEGRLGARTVGVHDVAILRVTAKYIGDNLAESPRENPLVYVLDSVVNVFFRCAYTAHHVSLITHS